jgi:hypothetical protein
MKKQRKNQRSRSELKRKAKPRKKEEWRYEGRER